MKPKLFSYNTFRQLHQAPDGRSHVVVKRRRKDTDEKKAKYLRALDEACGRITDACVGAGLTYDLVKHWRLNDMQFKYAEETIREGWQEATRDMTRDAVHNLILAENTMIVGKAMERLPEYSKTATITHKHEGSVGHFHYELSPAELTQLFDDAKEAIALEKNHEGTFE